MSHEARLSAAANFNDGSNDGQKFSMNKSRSAIDSTLTSVVFVERSGGDEGASAGGRELSGGSSRLLASTMRETDG